MDINLQPIFAGQAVTIVAGGSSLEGFNFARLRQPIIAVNDSAFKVKPAIVVAMDENWHKHYGSWLNEYTAAGGILVTDRHTHRADAIQAKLDGANNAEDWHIQKANLSGVLALALAFKLGAAKVYLLGYDGGAVRNGTRLNHYNNLTPTVGEKRYKRYNYLYKYWADKPVVNVGRSSKIDCFKKVKLNTDFYNA